jgi:hypothetical protein
MLTRDALVAGVLAATDKVVQQVGNGDFHAASKSSADRRALLEQLAVQDPHGAEHGFLRALREAAAESDAALDAMKVATNHREKGGRLCMKA